MDCSQPPVLDRSGQKQHRAKFRLLATLEFATGRGRSASLGRLCWIEQNTSCSGQDLQMDKIRRGERGCRHLRCLKPLPVHRTSNFGVNKTLRMLRTGLDKRKHCSAAPHPLLAAPTGPRQPPDRHSDTMMKSLITWCWKEEDERAEEEDGREGDRTNRTSGS